MENKFYRITFISESKEDITPDPFFMRFDEEDKIRFIGNILFNESSLRIHEVSTKIVWGGKLKEAFDYLINSKLESDFVEVFCLYLGYRYTLRIEKTVENYNEVKFLSLKKGKFSNDFSKKK